MIINAIKWPVRVARYKLGVFLSNCRIVYRFNGKSNRMDALDSFSFIKLSDSVLEFVSELNVDGGYRYKYSASCNEPTLYASVYACMTLSLLGKFDNLPVEDRSKWGALFDGYQSYSDGLFYDPSVDSELYRSADWWGARHLALHMVSAYTALNRRPKHPFYFLEEYYCPTRIEKWLSDFDWSKSFTFADDIDNKIMNIGCLLQYQRDVWGDSQAGAAVAYLQKYLMDRINPETGMWGSFDVHNPEQRSRMVQFAYHLFPIFFYDNIQIQHTEKIIRNVLLTQNKFGGFGVRLNSSACEDMDSIDLLIRLAPLLPHHKEEIDAALSKAFNWVLCNQVNDGGFVFRLHERFIFGHAQTSSRSNEGAMLPTWFRILSLAYLEKYFGTSSHMSINRCPGYEF